MEAINEVWKEIPSHPNYEVSDLGRVRHKVGVFNGRVNPGKILKPASERGYLRVLLCDMEVVCRGVHILVAEAFIGPRPHRLGIDHIDHDRSNNIPSNLRYLSHGKNVWRSPYYDGRRRPITDEPKRRGKFFAHEVADIRERIANKERGVDIAKVHNCSPSLISRIKSGERQANRHN